MTTMTSELGTASAKLCASHPWALAVLTRLSSVDQTGVPASAEARLRAIRAGHLQNIDHIVTLSLVIPSDTAPDLGQMLADFNTRHTAWRHQLTGRNGFTI